MSYINMNVMYLNGKGLGVLFNKAWKVATIRFLFNEDRRWTSGEIYKCVNDHLAPNSIGQTSITFFLQELERQGLLKREDRRGKGARGGGQFYKRVGCIDGVWEHQINRMLQACVDGWGGPLMFQGSWIYPTGASDLHHVQGE